MDPKPVWGTGLGCFGTLGGLLVAYGLLVAAPGARFFCGLIGGALLLAALLSRRYL